MRLTIDTETKLLTCEDAQRKHEVALYSKEAFEIISREWLRVAWAQKYSYTFTWLGRPIIQLPEDVLRVQEVIYALRPDVIVETGIAHGGSLIFYASLCRLIGKGRVIGVDLLIKPANREAIERHDVSDLITLIEGDSTSPSVVDRVRKLVTPRDSVLVLLDSAHSREHVLKELAAYSPLVTPGSYIVATDGVMKDLADVPRGKAEWTWDNPTAAAAEFAARHPDFRLEPPAWLFNESELTTPITHWPGAWLRRIGR
jgi:cephalosporin hydroxylase